MFQYALGRTLSLKYNVPLKLDKSRLMDHSARSFNSRFVYRNYSLDLFSIDAQMAVSSEIPWQYRLHGRGLIKDIFYAFFRRLIPQKGKEKSFYFDQGILDIGSDAYLDGYWQSYKYFESITDVIRKDFILKDSLPEEIQSLKREIESCDSVCLHVRRGDYVGNVFHEIIGKEYYDDAIEKLSQMRNIGRLYVFSDDIAWCRDNLSFSFPVTFVGEEFAGERGTGHFSLMQACKYFIIPNSSFGWWAAWLARDPRKVVIAPERWLGDKTVSAKDIIPKDWFQIGLTKLS